MSRIDEQVVECAYCGQKSKQIVVLSTNNFGGMDLDTRPGGMSRSMIGYQIQECPHCHYCNYNIGSINGQISMQFEQYIELLNDSSRPLIAKRYQLAGLLSNQLGNNKLAGLLFLRSAWVCDDENNVELAKSARSLAAQSLSKHVASTNDGDVALMLVDIYRRASMFNEANDMILQIGETGNSELDAIVSFQQKLINESNSNCYTVEDVGD